jgi:DNA processing protein
MRNAVMSGYGIASIIVEASEHSGARIQARLAVEHGRPVILTDGVVEATVWGRELTHQPDVHVASSTAQVINIVTEIEQRRAALPGLLSALAMAK